ncbi:5-(carboxyamino)imidazole ribonucleotide synthase [Thermocrinis sp.]
MRIGILGGGQLGWMTILEGRKLGFEFLVLDKSTSSPACKISDLCFDYEKVDEFVKLCDVITYEFEHIPDEVLEKTSYLTLPSVEVLKLKKSKVEEKVFLRKRGYPVPNFTVATNEDLERAADMFELPVVVKSESLGYDGKGQYLIKEKGKLKDVKSNHPQGRFLVEEFVDFDFELSIIGVRNAKGEALIYPPTINHHEEGILIYNKSTDLAFPEAKEITKSLIEELNIVGLLCVEFFYTKDGKLLINEIAPRAHNTGHYTLDGSYTSQFENLIRAITGLPLGSTKLKSPSGMINIIGKSYEEMDIRKVLSVDGAKLYWYGKEKRYRRKMGHVNVVGSSQEDVERKLEYLYDVLFESLKC